MRCMPLLPVKSAKITQIFFSNAQQIQINTLVGMYTNVIQNVFDNVSFNLRIYGTDFGKYL